MLLECRTCGAGLSIAAAERTAICPYCASPSVLERPEALDRPNPVFAIGFTVTREVAAAAVRRWARDQARRFRRSGIDRAPVEDIRGIYVPAYLYSAVASAEYRARIGERYTEVQTYTTTVNGKLVTRTRTVTKTEWRDLGGRYDGYLADLLVTSSRGLSNPEMEALEPFDLGLLRRYGPELVSGWIAEEPTLSQAECLALARGEAVAAIGRRLSDFMPGDTHADLRYQTTVDREVLDLVLVPVWVLAVRHDPKAPPLRVLVNGQTGEVVGKAPLSWGKILAAVGGGLALLGLLGLAAWLIAGGP